MTMKNILKISSQIILILLVAGIICGALYVIVQSGLLPTRGGRPEGGAGPAQFQGSARPPRSEFGGERDGGEHGGISLGRGFVGMFGSLIKIAVITVLVLLVQNFFSRRNQKQKIPA
jgi:hypothetical protein